jgi:type I restriction-modification system DNA methylase subunit
MGIFFLAKANNASRGVVPGVRRRWRDPTEPKPGRKGPSPVTEGFLEGAHYEKGKRQNFLNEEHIDKIIDTYRYRREETQFSRRVGMDEIRANDYNLNISRYVSTAESEPEVDLQATHQSLVEVEQQLKDATARHNAFLKELGLPPLPQ